MLILITGRYKAGFTLLELIVILFIVSIVMALVIPSFSNLGEDKVKSEAGEMASIFRYMHDSAVSRKEIFMIKFNLNEDIVCLNGPDGERIKKFDNLTGVTTQSRGMISSGELIFFFEPIGIREDISVYLHKGDKEMIITLNHLSGRVKIINNLK